MGQTRRQTKKKFKKKNIEINGNKNIAYQNMWEGSSVESESCNTVYLLRKFSNW